MIRMISEGLIVLLVTASPEALCYRAPAGADSADLYRVSQALSARCKGYGYQGIHAQVVEQVCSSYVRITCESGFTTEMVTTLNMFAQLGASAVELRFPAILTETEKQQYQPGASVAEDKAPARTKWYRFMSPEESPVLLRDAPEVTTADIKMKLVQDPNGVCRWIWEINPPMTRRLREAERKGQLGTPYLLIDGWVVEAVSLNGLTRSDDGNEVEAERMSFAPVSRIIRAILSNPMPFALEPTEVGEGN